MLLGKSAAEEAAAMESEPARVFRCAPLICTGCVRRAQLQQAILNLVVNASEVMSSLNERPLQLIIRQRGDRVRLSVQDVGVGADPQGVSKLFEDVPCFSRNP